MKGNKIFNIFQKLDKPKDMYFQIKNYFCQNEHIKLKTKTI